MMQATSTFRRIGIAVALFAALSACANRNAEQTSGLAGAATPGSEQFFVVNIGPRVFFESDPPELTPQGRTPLEKQAQWLAQYTRYAFTVEGHADERAPRKYNIARGARR